MDYTYQIRHIGQNWQSLIQLYNADSVMNERERDHMNRAVNWAMPQEQVERRAAAEERRIKREQLLRMKQMVWCGKLSIGHGQ